MLAIEPTYHRRGARLAIAGALAAGILGALAASASGAPSPSAPTLLIGGAGSGHGVGMSQEGALGYARRSYSYRAILAHYYTGTELGTAPPGAYVRVLVGSGVQRIPLERYVRGVVAAEMPASWPLAALEAQAVASRTYALTAHSGGSQFDVYSDTRSQVYRGAAAETAATNAAVAATAGQVVTYGVRPATTYFFASSGGMTENVENVFIGSAPEPWLKGVVDPFDSGASHDWTVTMSFATASARLRGLVKGGFRGVEVLRRGVSPRIVAAEVLGSRGQTPVSGPELAARLGLADTWAYFSVRAAGAVKSEPDLSSRAPAATPGPSAPAARAQGGAQAPGPAPAEIAASGGTVAR